MWKEKSAKITVYIHPWKVVNGRRLGRKMIGESKTKVEVQACEQTYGSGREV